MSKFWMVVEDPDYDEDGILIDEDDQILEMSAEMKYCLDLEDFDPFETINS
jgi:hypothetical protein